MTSTVKIEANRRNAKRSTGPKTPHGKAISALNALRHGLTAEQHVLPDEDREAFAASTAAFRAELEPVGPLEASLVDRISGLVWRLRRAGRVEASLFRHEVLNQEAIRLRRQAADLEIKDGFNISTDMLQRIASAIKDPEKHESLLSQAAAADAARDQETLATTFISDATSANALSKLSRYEVSLERSLYRALHELQRLQAARAGEPAPLAGRSRRRHVDLSWVTGTFAKRTQRGTVMGGSDQGSARADDKHVEPGTDFGGSPFKKKLKLAGTTLNKK